MVTARQTTKVAGDEAEAQALAHLTRHGLTLVQRNYRVAAGPRARGGEVDLIVRERDGTLVFVEVRARHSPPPCRFDVVAIDAGVLQWLKAAFSTE